MANINHAAALKAAKKRVWYLENRERILAEAKERRDAEQVETETVIVTKTKGKYSLQLGDLKLVVSPDATVVVSKVGDVAPAPKVVELKSNGQPYKTTAAQRAAVAKWRAQSKPANAAQSSLSDLNSMVRSISR